MLYKAWWLKPVYVLWLHNVECWYTNVTVDRDVGGGGDGVRRQVEVTPPHIRPAPPGASFTPGPSLQPIGLPHHTPGLTNRHILSVSMFSKEQLHQLFNLAHSFRVAVHKERPLDYILKVSFTY